MISLRKNIDILVYSLLILTSFFFLILNLFILFYFIYLFIFFVASDLIIIGLVGRVFSNGLRPGFNPKLRHTKDFKNGT